MAPSPAVEEGRTRPGRTARVLRALYLVTCNTLLLLLLLEIGWRALAGQDEQALGPRRRMASPERVGYSLHPYFQMVFPPDRKTDPGPDLAGWRVDPPGAAFDSERLQVLFLGGSTTATEYPGHVRRMLEPELGPATAYNLSWSWHCSLHSLYKLWTYVDAIEPDLVVVLHNVNDFYRGFTPPSYALPQYRPDYSHYSGALSAFWSLGRSRYDRRPVFYARPGERYGDSLDPPDRSVGGLFRGLAARSEVLRALSNRFGESRAERRKRERAARRPARFEDELLLRSLPSFERNLRNLRESCVAKGLPVVFLTMPFTVEIDDPTFMFPGEFLTNDGVDHVGLEDFRRGLTRFNQAVLEVETDDPLVQVFDLASAIGDAALFEDEVHLTPEGLVLEGELVSAFLLESGLLDGGGH
jgi:hypothetical protein